MQATRQRLLELLADGAFHSGVALGQAVGISRGAVWKQIAGLNALGIDVFRVPGRGYRLARPLELLSRAAIDAALRLTTRKRLAEVLIFDSVASTNSLLMEYRGEGVIACLAEHQQAGRGRRGRHWVSPFGANLYLSLSWPFAGLPPDFPALGLAAGVAARRALLEAAGLDVRLKWPNDLYVDNAKLGGILLEMRGEPSGACRVVAGIGINMSMPDEAAVGVDQPWTDVARAGGAVSRNALAAALLHHWVAAFATFELDGFAGFREEWQAADLLAGAEVEVSDGARVLRGRAEGVATDGALQLRSAHGVHRIVAGDVSLRRAR